jgi:hypothetical protein
MKYYTKEWCFSNLDDQEIEARQKSYDEYINKIYEKLPFTLKIMTRHINLHDGIIESISFCQEHNLFVLKGIFGDLQTGYFLLEIKYLKTRNLTRELLMATFNDQKLNILSDEFEAISACNYSHRILFSSKQEIEIFFQDIEVYVRNTTAASYKQQSCKIELACNFKHSP